MQPGCVWEQYTCLCWARMPDHTLLGRTTSTVQMLVVATEELAFMVVVTHVRRNCASVSPRLDCF